MTALRDAIDYTTLGWVKPELDETLRQARIEIEGYAEDPADSSRMRFCAGYLHQVQGTLRMVELYAPAMVAEEMEQLAQALHKGMGDHDSACATLMRGAVLLPDYLERLQSGHKDIPIVLLPLLNELRAARGEAGLSESVLFAPDLDRQLPASVPASQDSEASASPLQTQLGELREQLAGWTEDDKPDDAAALSELLLALLPHAADESARRMLWVAGSVAQVLRDGGLAASPGLRQAYASVEREVRRMFPGTDDAVALPRPDATQEPTRQLLYHVAHGGGDHAVLRELRQIFNLDAQLPTASELSHAQGSLSGRNRALLDTVSAAIKDDLLRVKDALDLHLRTGETEVAHLQPQVDLLGRIADTVGMLGLGVARNVVQEQREVLRAIVEGYRPADEGALLDVAGALLYVDALLDDQVAHLGVDDAPAEDGGVVFASESHKLLGVIVREAIANFADARQAFVAFVETNWDHGELVEVPRLLAEVSGAFSMLELLQPADYLTAVRLYTESELLSRKRVPNGRQLDTFADALASLEYYLEALRDNRLNRDDILDVTRNSLESLGYWPLPDRPVQPAVEKIPDAGPSARHPDGAQRAVDELLGRAAVHARQPDGAAPAAGAQAPAPAEPVHAPAPVAPAGQQSGGFEATGDEIDDEIREVFLEEFAEEIDNLDQLLPLWRADPDNLERLRPIRRVFHTLKGSGRLVGARTLGEFSWKIETLLNRVLEGSRPASAAVVAMVDQAFYTLPQLQATLRGDGVVRADLERIQAAAERIAQGDETMPEPVVDAIAGAPEPVAADDAIASQVTAPVDAESAADEAAATAGVAIDTVPAAVDALLLEILESEVAGHLESVDAWVAQSRVDPHPASEALLRAVHTMNGAFAMTEVPALSDVLSPAEGFVRRLLASGQTPTEQGVAVIGDLAQLVRAAIVGLHDPSPHVPVGAALAAQLLSLRDSLPDVAPVQLGSAKDDAVAQSLPDLAEVELTAVDLAAYRDLDSMPEGAEPAWQGARETSSAGEEPAEQLEQARIEAERLEAERVEAERIESERVAAEQLEQARIEAQRLEADRLEAERAAAEQREHECIEAERLESERAEAARTEEAERLEYARLEAEYAEQDRIAREQQAEAERADAARIEAEHAEAARIEAERVESERVAAEQLEQTRIEAQRLEDERAELERAAAEQREHERIEAERIEAEHAGAARIEAKRLEAKRLEAERLEAERAAEQAAAEAVRVQAESTAAAASEPEAAAKKTAYTRTAALDPTVAAMLAQAQDGAEDPDEALDLIGLDPELIDIFVEESGDLLDHADGLLAQLRDAPDEREPLVGLQRDLHTLKGGARMAGIMAIGELGHAMESLLEAVVEQRSELGRDGIPLLERGFDRLHAMVTRAGARRAIGPSQALVDDFDARSRGITAAERAAAEAMPARMPAPKVELKPLSAPISEMADVEDDDVGVRAPQEQVRIRADLLDRLVNYAGEVAIYRARLEQQLGAFRSAMAEMEQTNARLRDQLRRLDSETEAQIIARYQREHEVGDETFDPLELDRFSTLQQLSRGLGESAADLASLQGTLDELTRQYEILLLQQSRVSSDLQEGLMRTRMVPFDALVPRLRRIVRQAAGETGKQVQLRLDGAQGELDRNVLERMTAPLEHMLRNAVAHGLETPEQRRKANKGEEGTVHIAVRREGSEVVLEVGDDGSGLDRVAIRRRGEERGLLRADAVLADSDLDMLIFEPGFSTVDEVSRLAGRGVGMDVVASEVRQLGGTLDIATRKGEGTTFILRLPQTLAVTQAVFVRIGETSFAVPIASVRGVGRIGRDAFMKPDASYAYGGEDYTVHDLGGLVGHAPAKAEGQLQMPLLLIRAGDLRAAVAVDQIVGNREIVVKPAGPQVASVPGIFGATIMGDGRVVVILDVAPLVRRQATLPRDHVPAPAVEQRAVPLVMVVDDSVTMRKVTGRVLERHNFEVVTARDGIDALERMAERVPDLMLLDIEMPRMDGYELAIQMKADPRLRNVPIVMITSRTGEKHRQRAFEIGVQRYLGKPYQENELVRNVYELLELEHDDA
ncbi:MAG: Hpt domain-containing protein [Pseudomonadota bacterium]|nr:Hpt domain-containing protein [Pseudomonadota bacterium]